LRSQTADERGDPFRSSHRIPPDFARTARQTVISWLLVAFSRPSGDAGFVPFIEHTRPRHSHHRPLGHCGARHGLQSAPHRPAFATSERPNLWPLVLGQRRRDTWKWSCFTRTPV